jgi:hypothetical protein
MLDNSAYNIVISQIHVDPTLLTKPVAELFYSSSSAISMGVKQTQASSNEVLTTISTIPVGTKFSYMISYKIMS